MHFCLNSLTTDASVTDNSISSRKILVIIELTEDLKAYLFGTPQDTFLFTSHLRLRKGKDFVFMPKEMNPDNYLARFVSHTDNPEKSWLDFTKQNGITPFTMKLVSGADINSGKYGKNLEGLNYPLKQQIVIIKYTKEWSYPADFLDKIGLTLGNRVLNHGGSIFNMLEAALKGQEKHDVNVLKDKMISLKNTFFGEDKIFAAFIAYIKYISCLTIGSLEWQYTNFLYNNFIRTKAGLEPLEWRKATIEELLEDLDKKNTYTNSHNTPPTISKKSRR